MNSTHEADEETQLTAQSPEQRALGAEQRHATCLLVLCYWTCMWVIAAFLATSSSYNASTLALTYF